MIPLPIDPHLPRIVQTLRAEKVLALIAEPGAGKTTRVPRAMLDAGFATDGEILVLEPRRLAVRMAARRVAEELGEKIGGTIGYTIRFDDRSSRKTKVRFVTEAVLLRRLSTEPELPGVAAVVLDEFHERHLVGDLGLALLARLRKNRPELVVAVMSATLDADAVSTFLECAVEQVPGRTHPIDLSYLDKPADRRLENEVASAVRRAVRQTEEGDVLVFLPGAAEIRRAGEACGAFAKQAGLDVVSLHGDLPPAEQDRAIRPGPRRKVILSTNVAESSVTIEGVRVVIDSGLARIARDDPWSGLPQLVTDKISQASATQRAGRAGRLGPGLCLRLYTRHDHDTRPSHDIAEILRADLAETSLLLRSLGEDPASFLYFEAPKAAALEAADELLARLGAVHDGSLTDDGRAMLRFPLHPRLARLVLCGASAGVGRAAATVAAIFGERELRLTHRTRLSDRSAAPDVEVGASDVLARFEAFDAWSHDGADGSAARRYEIDLGTAKRIERARAQLLRVLGRDTGQPPDDPDERDEVLLRCILAAYPDRVARRRKAHGDAVVLAGGGSAKLAPNSVVREAELMVAAEVTGAKAVVRAASAIEPEWLLELFPDRIVDVDEVHFDPQRERVTRIVALRYDGLVLDESRSDDIDDERAAVVLADAAVSAGVQKFCDADGLEMLKRRLAFAVEHGAEVPTFDDEFIRSTLRTLCTGMRSFAELRSIGLLETIRGSLGTDALRTLDRFAPATVNIPGRARVEVHYEVDRPPWIEAYLQEFFGLSESPTIAAGRVPLVLHPLAPNGRAVQVTTDLAGFWDRHYPTLRKELMRRYPKHHFPEEPRTAPPKRFKRLL